MAIVSNICHHQMRNNSFCVIFCLKMQITIESKKILYSYTQNLDSCPLQDPHALSAYDSLTTRMSLEDLT